MRSKSYTLKSKAAGEYMLSDATDEFMLAKARRKTYYLNHSKGIPSEQAVNDAKLIPNLKPSDVKILKFSE